MEPRHREDQRPYYASWVGYLPGPGQELTVPEFPMKCRLRMIQFVGDPVREDFQYTESHVLEDVFVLGAFPDLMDNQCLEMMYYLALEFQNQPSFFFFLTKKLRLLWLCRQITLDKFGDLFHRRLEEKSSPTPKSFNPTSRQSSSFLAHLHSAMIKHNTTIADDAFLQSFFQREASFLASQAEKLREYLVAFWESDEKSPLFEHRLNFLKSWREICPEEKIMLVEWAKREAWRQFIWDGLDAPSEPSDRDLPLMFDVLCPEIADTAELVTNQGRKFISLLDKVASGIQSQDLSPPSTCLLEYQAIEALCDRVASQFVHPDQEDLGDDASISEEQTKQLEEMESEFRELRHSLPGSDLWQQVLIMRKRNLCAHRMVSRCYQTFFELPYSDLLLGIVREMILLKVVSLTYLRKLESMDGIDLSSPLSESEESGPPPPLKVPGPPKEEEPRDAATGGPNSLTPTPAQPSPEPASTPGGVGEEESVEEESAVSQVASLSVRELKTMAANVGCSTMEIRSCLERQELVALVISRMPLPPQ